MKYIPSPIVHEKSGGGEIGGRGGEERERERERERLKGGREWEGEGDLPWT